VNLSFKQGFSLFFLALIIFIGVYGLADAGLPLLLSFGLAYITFPLIHKLEKRGIHRILVIAIVALVFLSLVGVLVLIVIPKVWAEVTQFFHELPKFIPMFIHKVQFFFEQIGYKMDIEALELQAYLRQGLEKVSATIVKFAAKAIGKGFGSIKDVILFFLNLFLIPMFYFYLITDFENIKKRIVDLIPPSWRENIKSAESQVKDTFDGYFKGQLVVALCLGTIYVIGLKIIGIKYSFVIGLIAGVMALIPYAGFIIGLSLSFIVASESMHTPSTYVFILGLFLVAQLIEGF
jgi:predicted PurR-regulated permease PerM